ADAISAATARENVSPASMTSEIPKAGSCNDPQMANTANPRNPHNCAQMVSRQGDSISLAKNCQTNKLAAATRATGKQSGTRLTRSKSNSVCMGGPNS